MDDAAENGGGATQSLTSQFTQGGSAPVSVLSLNSISGPVTRPAFRPQEDSVAFDAEYVVDLSGDDFQVRATDRDAALDDLFASQDLLDTAAEAATGLADGDEAFALLASGL